MTVVQVRRRCEDKTLENVRWPSLLHLVSVGVTQFSLLLVFLATSVLLMNLSCRGFCWDFTSIHCDMGAGRTFDHNRCNFPRQMADQLFRVSIYTGLRAFSGLK